VETLLYGPAPEDDDNLVRMAGELDTLMHAVTEVTGSVPDREPRGDRHGGPDSDRHGGPDSDRHGGPDSDRHGGPDSDRHGGRDGDGHGGGGGTGAASPVEGEDQR
jgi:hypothetical protein